MRTRKHNPIARVADRVFLGATAVLFAGYAVCLYSLARVF